MVSRLVILAAATTAGLGALDVAAGRALFDHAWVLAPSSVHGQAGLGPLYDARACGACHAGAGPGRIGQGVVEAGAVVRLGGPHGEPDPVYGEQIQTRAAPGLRPEAQVRLAWGEQDGRRTATVDLTALGYGPLTAGTRLSLRRAPGLAGVGLLEAVSDREILVRIHPRDRDGVAGRAAWLDDGHGGRRLGRWGWKAAQPMLEAQTAVALQRDIGVSTTPRPAPWGDCTPIQADCRRMAAGQGGAEASDAARGLIVAYLRSLQPPPAVPPFPAGEAVFDRSGCNACHTALRTLRGAPVRAFTDLLLHDMGPGLADGVGEGAAIPSEWRTAPLWDLSAELAAGGLLHDGRARSVAEAVAWHGGEATRSRARYTALNPRDRQALDRFLFGR